MTVSLKEFLDRLTPGQRRIITPLRRLIRRAAPDAAETILWGSLSYHRPGFGGRIKGAVCLLTPKPDGVHLGFIHGAALADPKGLLRGSAKSKRVVVIRDCREIDAPTVEALVRAADRYDPRARS